MLTDSQIQKMREVGLLHGEKMDCGHCRKLIDHINSLLEDLTDALY